MLTYYEGNIHFLAFLLIAVNDILSQFQAKKSSCLGDPLAWIETKPTGHQHGTKKEPSGSGCSFCRLILDSLNLWLH